MALVAANALAYVAMLGVAQQSDEALPSFILHWGLSRAAFEAWQPVTYQFVHDPGTIWHILGNMIFLWTFGSAVESRMGRIGFLAFYLTGGAVAGLVQLAVSPGPVIGASGSVSAVTGAFIALFPRARVAVLMLFSVFGIPAMLLVALYFAADLLGALGAGRGGVGHLAHLAGTVFGLLVTMALVATGIVRRNDMDLAFVLRQWWRRRKMRSALEGSAARPWAANAADNFRKEAEVASEHAARATARQAARARESAGASFARGDFAAAAESLETALRLAPGAADADESRLMLAVIHVRKLPDMAKAAAALDAIGTGLPAQLEPLRQALREELRA